MTPSAVLVSRGRICRLFAFGSALILAGCASTHVDVRSAAPLASSCQAPTEHLSALVVWGTHWRPDQKEPVRRELAAEQGITNFFAQSGCFAHVDVRRLPVAPTEHEEEVARLAATLPQAPDRVVAITVRELGPIVKLLSSWALVEGGTEVVADVAVRDPSGKALPHAFQVHWQNGGPGVVKGVASLPADMQSALAASFQPAAAGGRLP